MAVVVRYNENGNPVIRSLSGIGISESDRITAYKLDRNIKSEMKKLSKQLSESITSPKPGVKNKVEIYWKLGRVLRKIFYESELITPAEKPLYWMNVKLHAPTELLAKDRGPNRIHVEYCFRLASYPKKLALKMKWSEWVYLFDSPSINKEPRFDEWFEPKLENPHNTTREKVRIFTQCLNSMLKGIETSDLSDRELGRCYEGALILAGKLIEEQICDKSNRVMATKKISEKQNELGKLIEGEITPEQYSTLIINEIK